MRFAALLLAVFAVPFPGASQAFELGAQLTGMHLHKIDEAPFGVGARFHYNVTPYAAADAEWTKYPQNSSGNFGETAALIGGRAGKRFSRVGLFVKARFGVVHFGGRYFEQRLDRRTHALADIGGILEFYPSRRTFVRIDQGDAIIYYGGAKLFNRANPDALGTVHHYQPGFGFGFRF